MELVVFQCLKFIFLDFTHLRNNPSGSESQREKKPEVTGLVVLWSDHQLSS
jgi:hypothetical protein